MTWTRTRILCLVTFIVFLAAVGGYHFWTTTPTYSLRQAGLAWKNQDWEEFKKYVDVESVLKNGLDAIVEDQLSQAPIPEGAQATARNLVQLFKPQLLSILEKQVQDALLEKPDRQTAKDLTTPDITPSLKTTARNWQLEQINVGKASDDEVLVSITLRSPNPNEPSIHQIHLRMADRGDHWQVTEIVNMPELLTKFQNHL